MRWHNVLFLNDCREMILTSHGGKQSLDLTSQFQYRSGTYG